MKKLFSFILGAFALTSLSATAQDTTGMIAHWNMNSSPNDVSGNGHNGTLHGVVPAVGRDGVMGHGYYFDGNTSMITVPYSPSFNIQKYTICATVYPQGFYQGVCTANFIFGRGKSGSGIGDYYLCFSSQPYTGDCSVLDSMHENFETKVGSLDYISESDFLYTPSIAHNTWYSVVATCNDTVYKIYVDGVLKVTAMAASPGTPIGTSMDSVCIGYNIFEAADGYPFPFKGIIDDIKIYNRALSDTEAVTYTTSTLGVTNTDIQEVALQIVPNPAGSTISLQGNIDQLQHPVVTICDVLGRTIIRKPLNTGKQVDVAALAAGPYVLTVTSDNAGPVSRRFIKN